jgi:Transposase DDE domain
MAKLRLVREARAQRSGSGRFEFAPVVETSPLRPRQALGQTAGMFLRRNRRTRHGEAYEYWTLVQSERTARGPRQRVVAHLGKLPGLEDAERRGWEDIEALLEGRRPARQSELWDSQAPLAKEQLEPQWAQVDLRGVRVERVRDFGVVYLALSLWRRLGLHRLLGELIEAGREDLDWALVACILTIGRFCAQRSEREVAERWYADSALEDLLGVPWPKVNESRLYRGLDVLQGRKDQLFLHLQQRYQSWFGVGFEFLLYDVTSSFFEGQATLNPKALRGYSRDKRPDCKQVCIGLVVSSEGLPLAYEVFAGNRADVSTVEHIVTQMEAKYGQAQRIWVLDRGMVSEENLEFLRQRKARYIVGTPKAQLRRFEQALLEGPWQAVEPGVEVKLLDSPDGEAEQFILCRSAARQQKEAAIFELQRQRLLTKLREIDGSLRKRPSPEAATIERRIGRWLGRYTGAERTLDVKVSRDAAGQAVGLNIQERTQRCTWAQQAHGAYLLRTNCPERDPAQLWKCYTQLQQAEAAFRLCKSDLHLRPIFHQKYERVEAHILVCFLALALWRTLEQWMSAKGLGTCARQLLREVATVRSMDVVLPVKDHGELRLRVVGKPDRSVAELLVRLGVELPSRPKILENVVQKLSP